MKISFITAAYNRKYLLSNLFESLCSLKGDYFEKEWVLVDDGSDDGTNELIDDLKKSSPFTIKYLYKENSGKQSSLNIAFKLIESDISCVIDSDDIIDDSCLLELKADIEKINFMNDKRLSTIIYHSKDTDGNLIGSPFPTNYHVGKPYTFYNQHLIKGDKFDFFKTAVLKKYEFPIFDSEKFIAESVLWNDIHQSYDAVFINKSLQIVSYLDSGYTKNAVKLRINNPKSAIYVNLKGFELQTSYARKLRYCINYFRYKFHSKLFKFYKLELSFVNLLFIVPSVIIGYVIYLKDLNYD